MIRLVTAATALALVAGAALADPGGGKGGGHAKGDDGGKHGGHAAQVVGEAAGARGDRQAPSQGRAKDKAERGRGESPARQRAGRGNDPARSERPDKDHVGIAQARDDRGKRDDPGSDPRRAFDTVPSREKGPDRDRRGMRDDRGKFAWNDIIPRSARGVVAGCPPGLAKKGTGCLPPGLVKAAAPAVFLDSPTWWQFDRDWYGDVDWEGRYRYYDGYLVRYEDSGIDGWIPLLGGALSPGNQWPANYEPVALPAYYQDYYGLGPVDSYRYYDDVLYRVDPQTDAITAIAGLLTGNDFAIGQALPAGYDVYNVPYSYRDRYPDSPDASYRYSDGYVYRVDPTTQLIEAAIQLLT